MIEILCEKADEYAELYHKSKLSKLHLDTVSERTWKVDEILKELRPFQNADSAMAWFDRYGR